LRESYQSAGLGAEESFRVVGLLKMILARTAPKEREDGAIVDALELARDAFASFDTRSYLGVNVFDDVAWFNKERFDEALFYGELVAAIETDAALEMVPMKRTSEVSMTGVKGKAEAASPKGASDSATTATGIAHPSGAPHPSRIDVGHLGRRLETISRISDSLREAEASSSFRVDTVLEALAKGKTPEAARKPRTPKKD
jgi:hypothetical protein